MKTKTQKGVKVAGKSYTSKRYNSDCIFKENLKRFAVLNAILHNKVKNSRKALEYFSCSADEIRNHFDIMLKEIGLKWSQLRHPRNMKYWNPKKYWSVDHFIPVSTTYNDPDKMDLIWFYGNLRPVTWAENMKKFNYFDMV